MGVEVVWCPDADDVDTIHSILVEQFRGSADPVDPPGLRSRAYLESACTRPHTSIGSTEKYESVLAKAAALFHSLVKNHPYHNGNKRTALVTLLTTLHRNKCRLSHSVNDQEIFDFVVAVAANEFPLSAHSNDEVIDGIERWLKERVEKRQMEHREMNQEDFIARCQKAGCTVRRERKNNKIFVQNGQRGGLSFSGRNRRLPGKVVMNFMNKLGLTLYEIGLSPDEFEEGVDVAREQIRRYITVLSRLAKT